MPGLFSRIRGKDGKPKSKKNGYAESTPQLTTKPRWEDAYARTSVEPEEVQDLVNRCTVELKARGLDLPFLLLPFRPTSNPSAVRTFIRHFFNEAHGMHGGVLDQELRMTEPMVISDVLKWCWSRISGGLVGWDAYELFKVGEQDSNMARDAFSTFIPLSVENDARSKIVFDYFDLLSAIAAHGKANGFGGRKLSRMAAWWAFEHKDTGDGFEGGYKTWSRAADATSHLFFAYLRSLSPEQPRSAAISLLPMSLQKLLQDTEYPPQTPTLMLSSTYRVVMIVETVSPTPFALLRRASHFQYRQDDKTLQEFSEYEDPVTALTEECRRVLKAISLANQSQVSSAKHSTSLRDASWSRFEDIGFSATLEEAEEDEDYVKVDLPHAHGLRTTPASGVNLGRPTTPSWADFLSSGFVDDSAPSGMLLPPDKVLPPIETNIRQRSSQSHRPRLESHQPLEPGELASITRFDLDEAFWWVWMSSLAPEETAARKSAFGRCAVVETAIRSGKWLVMEEMVKGAAPEPDEGAYIAEKKGFFSWTRRGRGGVSRSKSTSKGAFDRRDKLNPSNAGSLTSKTSIGTDQQARIQAAARQLSAQQQQQRQAALPQRRGRTDADAAAEKTQSILTLQPVIMKEASPAMKWANKYDKDTIREAYLGDITAGRGTGHFNGTSETYGSMTNGGGQAPGVPDKSASLPPSRVQSPTPAPDEGPAVPRKNLEDIHPAERPGAAGRNSPLPPLPRGEEEDLEAARQTMASPEPGSVSPDQKKHKKLHKEEKKTGTSFRKLFGRHRRQSKLPENAANEVNNFLATQAAETAESSRAQSPIPETNRPQPIAQTQTPTVPTEDEKTPTQLSAPVNAREPTYEPSAEDQLSRVDTADANEAHNEFSRFDQGPLTDQPAFAPPDDDSEDEAVPPPIARHGSSPVEDYEGEGDAAPSPVIATQDRWAAIRRNAAERAAARQSEEQSRGGYSKTTDGDDETSGEETIESRVARIKARVAELTGNMEGTGAPGTPPTATRR
ncbi:hypothetical protein F5B22DRAFT_634481 [Xylaria bambusicola]|uniref:uncharacterized protein n=1 Tax=Xylaria bambusicola TaxID=326684 RepID=UPI00200872A3|nr:uncharacterized protein F5B22DRAFT_634481 [Xylaria bambusicola]KAI0521573.1 hypothetical protein F5B22DRAFT_634481 [Xylaria bambusicola]